MPRSERRKLLQAHLLARLRDECRTRGRAAEIANATGFTPAHISRVQRGKAQLGDFFAEALIELWNLDKHDLERLKPGGETERGRRVPPNLKAALDFCRDAYPREFLKNIEAQARRFGIDRSRVAWVIWLDAKAWEWKQKKRLMPERSGTFAWDERGPGASKRRSARSAG